MKANGESFDLLVIGTVRFDGTFVLSSISLRPIILYICVWYLGGVCVSVYGIWVRYLCMVSGCVVRPN